MKGIATLDDGHRFETYGTHGVFFSRHRRRDAVAEIVIAQEGAKVEHRSGCVRTSLDDRIAMGRIGSDVRSRRAREVEDM